MTTIQKQTVLITGCSGGGIGWAMAKDFHSRGYHVFATVRDPSKAADLASLSDVDIVHLDVTDSHSISQCKDTISNRTGGKLNVLVNNAGIESIRPLLDVDIAESKKMYDVNVWGPLGMVQAFAPLLIKAKGVIFNQSSIDAELSMVWSGILSSSKAAEARMSEILRHELKPLGVRVVTSMCGSAVTPMFEKPGGQMRLPESSYYYDAETTAYKERMDHKSKATKVDVLAEKLVKDIVGGAKGPIWHGAFASLVRYMSLFSLTWFVNMMINGERGLKQVKRL